MRKAFKELVILQTIYITEEIRYSYDLLSELVRKFLIIGLFPGKSGWTFIKTLPREFFCRRSLNIAQPRLSMLTTRTNCKAFHWSVYRENLGMLLEANEQGQIYVSDGNESDRAIFAQLIREFNQEWDIDALFVADAALYSKENLEQIKSLRWLFWQLTFWILPCFLILLSYENTRLNSLLREVFVFSKIHCFLRVAFF